MRHNAIPNQKPTTVFDLMMIPAFVDGFISYKLKETYNYDKTPSYERGRQFAILFVGKSPYNKDGSPSWEGVAQLKELFRQKAIV